MRVEVIDRQHLVLEIFSQRANSQQARLQVAIAALQFERSKLGGGRAKRLQHIWEALDTHVTPYKETTRIRSDIVSDVQQGAKLTIQQQQNLIDTKLSFMRQNLEVIKQSRDLQRTSRQRNVQTVALVGYTNAGKTELMNKVYFGRKYPDFVFSFAKKLRYFFCRWTGCS